MAQPTAIDQMFAFFAIVHDPRRQPPTTGKLYLPTCIMPQ
jgi:hypothetical protein